MEWENHKKYACDFSAQNSEDVSLLSVYFLLSVNVVIGELAYAQRSSVAQGIFIKIVILIVQDYCKAAHSGCVIKPVAPTDVVYPLSYNLNEQAYQKRKRNKHQICIALFVLFA